MYQNQLSKLKALRAIAKLSDSMCVSRMRIQLHDTTPSKARESRSRGFVNAGARPIISGNCKLRLAGLALTSCLFVQGCAVLEETADIALGTVEFAGEVVLFTADVATFGMVSTLTGTTDADWAASPEQTLALASGVASAYASANSYGSGAYSSPSTRSGTSSPSYGTQYRPTSTYQAKSQPTPSYSSVSNASSAKTSSQSSTSKKAGRIEKEPASQCLSLERSTQGSNFWVNRCGYKVYVEWRDEGSCSWQKSAGCGSHVGPYAKSSISSAKGRVEWGACKYEDFIEFTRQGHKCYNFI